MFAMSNSRQWFTVDDALAQVLHENDDELYGAESMSGDSGDSGDEQGGRESLARRDDGGVESDKERSHFLDVDMDFNPGQAARTFVPLRDGSSDGSKNPWEFWAKA